MPGPPSVDCYYVGVDVGSCSVRAALVTRDGCVKATAEESITVWTPQPDHYEQSSADIWRKCCSTVKKVTEGVEKDRVRGIGFDATCSLVVLDQSFQPVAVNKDGVKERNVVMWMDHRALDQASRITATGHSVLTSVGGVMSPEMQPPKLLWLKENLRESCWKEAAHFLDLPDFLSWKATGSLARSLCTLVCKWTYSPSDGWNDNFWTSIGLEDLLENNHSKIGEQTCCPGSPVGGGLTREAAADLGLNPGTAVGASLIDAHAGGLGVIGADVSGHHLPCENQPVTSRVALICGTSSCHMAVSQKPLFVPGVWGPYLSAMVPGLWLNEGGQSATGGLIDHVVKGHAAFPLLKEQAEKSGQHVHSFLNRYLEELSKDKKHLDLLTNSLHVWPDFHGNRSPLADQSLKGMVVGLSLSQTLDDLALLYLATLQAVALGTRHILDAMREAGHDITTLFLCGGLSKNPLFVQMHANVTGVFRGIFRRLVPVTAIVNISDTTIPRLSFSLWQSFFQKVVGLPVVLPAEREAVLVGAAVLGACASCDYSSIQEAMEKMGKVGKVIRPNLDLASFYRKKYAVFLRLHVHQREYAALMRD